MAACFKADAEPKEVPVSIADVLADPRDRGASSRAGPPPRHPEDRRAGLVRACCRDGVCCRDGRCFLCEGRLPSALECARWWQAYLPGLPALRIAAAASADCCFACEAFATCAAVSLAYYACPCFPAAACAIRVKDTLMRRRAVWGPFCDDRPRRRELAGDAEADPLSACFVEMWEDRVRRDAGWQPRARRGCCGGGGGDGGGGDGGRAGGGWRGAEGGRAQRGDRKSVV